MFTVQLRIPALPGMSSVVYCVPGIRSVVYQVLGPSYIGYIRSLGIRALCIRRDLQGHCRNYTV